MNKRLSNTYTHTKHFWKRLIQWNSKESIVVFPQKYLLLCSTLEKFGTTWFVIFGWTNWQLRFIIEVTSYPLWDRVYCNNHNPLWFFSESCVTWFTLEKGEKSISVHWHYSADTMTCNLRTASHRDGSPKPGRSSNNEKSKREQKAKTYEKSFYLGRRLT